MAESSESGGASAAAAAAAAAAASYQDGDVLRCRFYENQYPEPEVVRAVWHRALVPDHWQAGAANAQAGAEIEVAYRGGALKL